MSPPRLFWEPAAGPDFAGPSGVPETFPESAGDEGEGTFGGEVGEGLPGERPLRFLTASQAKIPRNPTQTMRMA